MICLVCGVDDIDPIDGRYPLAPAMAVTVTVHPSYGSELYPHAELPDETVTAVLCDDCLAQASRDGKLTVSSRMTSLVPEQLVTVNEPDPGVGEHH